MAEGGASFLFFFFNLFLQTRAAHLVNRLKPCVTKKCRFRLGCIIFLEVLHRYIGLVAM